MITCFVDTEFTDFLNMQLISLGMITEDGKHEIYVEINDYDKKASSSFVKEIVEPLLCTEGYTKVQAGAKVGSWLDELPDNEITIVFDYQSDYDLLLDLIDVPPAGKILKPCLIHPNLRAKAILSVVGRPSLDRVLASDATNFLSMNDAIKETSTKFFNGAMEFFYATKLPNHHALNDAKANRAGWIEAINFIEGRT